MKTEKLFTVVGTTTDPRGVTKVRFGNDLVSRHKVFSKGNHTNVRLNQLPAPMTKLGALQHLRGLPEFTTAAPEVTETVESAISSYAASKSKQSNVAAQ